MSKPVPTNPKANSIKVTLFHPHSKPSTHCSSYFRKSALAQFSQVPMEEKVLIPKTQQRLQNIDQIYDVISRSRPVQDHVHNIRKSQSADSIISSMLKNEHSIWVKLMSNQSFGRKLGSPGSNLTARRTSAHNLVATDALVDGGARSPREREHVIEFWATMPSSEVQEEHPHEEDDGSINTKENLDSVLSMKMKMEPSFPIYLKFSDVGYKVIANEGPSSVSMKYILQGVTGSVNPGEVLALMGPSGGGKTTLLNLLSGRTKIKDHGGSITYNDKPFFKSLKKRIGFVLQDDIVFPHLTVRETLTYAALLRLPKTLTREQKEERVMNVIFDLGLERCQDTIIGGTYMRGISGGERKRVCIGNEILLDPSLLFLDEPTSGLDSTTALRIIQMLHSIAHAGKTVVTTIHQPSSRLFNMFDKLILLGKGSSLYFGKASEAMLYFSSIGCSPLIPMNPAEFLIDLANGNINDKSMPLELELKFLDGCQEIKHLEGRSSSMDIHEYLVGAYETKFAGLEKQKLLKAAPIDTRWIMQGGSDLNESRISWMEQCRILFWRGLKARRHEYLSCIRVIQVLATAVIVGLLWWHSDASTPKRLQDQAGLLFFVSVFWGYFPVFAAIFTFPKERAMLAKERSVHMYKLSAYFIARTMSDLPLDLILPLVFLLIVYFMAGLKTDFIIFIESTLTIFLSIVAAQGLGLGIGAALMDIKQATTLASVIIMTFMLAGGFFIQRVPSFMSWIRYLSFNYHAYRLLLKVQYGCTSARYSASNACKSPFITGLGIDDGGMEVGAMLAMVFGYRLLAYLFLRKMKLRSS